MSEEKKGSLTTAWVSGVLVALLLYGLSWGPVRVHYTHYHEVGGVSLLIPQYPKWVQAFYSPLDLLFGLPYFRQPAADYYQWCLSITH